MERHHFEQYLCKMNAVITDQSSLCFGNRFLWPVCILLESALKL